MNQNEMKVIDVLVNLGIDYKKVEHPPVFTVEEAKRLCKIEGTGCKNLFLKENGRKNYYLIIMLDSKKADLKAISNQLKVSRLSFAKEEELYSLLGLKPGGVTPFGLLNDIDKVVTVVIDDELENSVFVSFHPNVNTSTLILRYRDFERYLEWSKNKVEKIII